MPMRSTAFVFGCHTTLPGDTKWPQCSVCAGHLARGDGVLVRLYLHHEETAQPVVGVKPDCSWPTHLDSNLYTCVGDDIISVSTNPTAR